jgi:hypothetical protein
VFSFVSAAAQGSVSRVCTGCLILEFRGGVSCGKAALRSFGDFHFTGKQTMIKGSIGNKLRCWIG